MKQRFVFIGVVLAFTSATVWAQGPFSAQIQQFYQFLLTAPQSVSGTWTFNNVVINGSCTGSGCGGGGGTATGQLYASSTGTDCSN